MRTTLNSAGLVVLGALLAGCECFKTVGPGDECFFPEEQKYVSQRAGLQQAASAARADATLYPAHFHGDQLNSLGEQKLALILGDDDQSRPLPMFLDLSADDELADGRRTSVLSFLEAHGVPVEQVRLESGPNPRAGTPLAPLMKNMGKTDTVAGSAPEGMK